MLILKNTHTSKASEIADMLVGLEHEFLMQLLSVLSKLLAKADECERILNPDPAVTDRAAGAGASAAAG